MSAAALLTTVVRSLHAAPALQLRYLNHWAIALGVESALTQIRRDIDNDTAG